MLMERAINPCINNKNNYGSLNFVPQIYDFYQCQLDLSEVLFPQCSREKSALSSQLLSLPWRLSIWPRSLDLLRESPNYRLTFLDTESTRAAFTSTSPAKPESLCSFSWKKLARPWSSCAFPTQNCCQNNCVPVCPMLELSTFTQEMVSELRSGHLLRYFGNREFSKAKRFLLSFLSPFLHFSTPTTCPEEITPINNIFLWSACLCEINHSSSCLDRQGGAGAARCLWV